jgi:hypothetical protein
MPTTFGSLLTLVADRSILVASCHRGAASRRSDSLVQICFAFVVGGVVAFCARLLVGDGAELAVFD